MKFNIPTGVEPPKSTEARSLLIYSANKMGKTALAAQIPNSILIEHEVGGADAVASRSIRISDPNHLPDLFAQLAQDPTIKVIVIDTITFWDEMSELVGTYNYMSKPQGKKWNVIDGVRVNHLDPRFDTVHAIGEGYGYRYSREAMVKWYNAAIATGKTIVFLAHVKDKYIESKSGEVVETSDINLTGKVKGIYSSRVDAIASLKRSGNSSWLVFENMGKALAGSRYAYLKGEILIGESDENNVLTTYWEGIFPSLFKK